MPPADTVFRLLLIVLVLFFFLKVKNTRSKKQSSWSKVIDETVTVSSLENQKCLICLELLIPEEELTGLY